MVVIKNIWKVNRDEVKASDSLRSHRSERDFHLKVRKHLHLGASKAKFNYIVQNTTFEN